MTFVCQKGSSGKKSAEYPEKHQKRLIPTLTSKSADRCNQPKAKILKEKGWFLFTQKGLSEKSHRKSSNSVTKGWFLLHAEIHASPKSAQMEDLDRKGLTRADFYIGPFSVLISNRLFWRNIQHQQMKANLKQMKANLKSIYVRIRNLKIVICRLQ